MASREAHSPMHIRITDAEREGLTAALRRFCDEEFDVSLSDYQGERLIEFFVRHLGAPVYNRAIQDARAALQSRLDELDGELYEPEVAP